MGSKLVSLTQRGQKYIIIYNGHMGHKNVKMKLHNLVQDIKVIEMNGECCYR